MRRASFDNDGSENSTLTATNDDDGNENGGDDDEDEEDEEVPQPRRRSVTSQSAEMYRRNSYREAIETFHLADVYKESKKKQLEEWDGKAERGVIARLRWLNAMHTVLRGVRAVNAFMPSEYRKRKKKDDTKISNKSGAWHAVKKTAVQQAVQNRMAMEFKVEEVDTGVKTIGERQRDIITTLLARSINRLIPITPHFALRRLCLWEICR